MEHRCSELDGQGWWWRTYIILIAEGRLKRISKRPDGAIQLEFAQASVARACVRIVAKIQGTEDYSPYCGPLRSVTLVPS